MKISQFVVFGLVLCGALTACGEAKERNPVESEAVTGSLDAGAVQGADAATPDGSVDATVPLVVPPVCPVLPTCTSPYAPVLEAVPAGAQLPVFANAADGLSTGMAEAAATAPSNGSVATSIALPDVPSTVFVFAKLSLACPDAVEFTHQYSVVTAFAPAAGVAGSSAITKDDPRIVAWATRIFDVAYGDGVTEPWKTPDKALGPATLDTGDIVSLGEGGSVNLGFDVTITDGDGYDFAVFENGFADNYLELGYVEVSSDGQNFVRFDTASLVPAYVGAYGTLDPTQFEGLAGKYRLGFGTPFDLAWLAARPEVRAGLVDLQRITVIRVVDVIGDGRERDSFGHVIYDPYPTTGSAGFDLDAVAVLNRGP